MMGHDSGKCQKGAHVLMSLSFITLVLAALVSIVQLDLWLAGTQWILISILLAVYAVAMINCSCGDSCEHESKPEESE